MSNDTSTEPTHLRLPAFTSLGEADKTRRVSLNEMMSNVFDGPSAAMLGTVNEMGGTAIGMHTMWGDTVTEDPQLGATEVWEIYNFTEDAHPIHLHLVQFQVLERQTPGGDCRGPEIWETGYKDTVIETTR